MAERIAEHIGEKSGLRIIIQQECDLPELIAQRIITRELLETHGFLLLENFGGRMEERPHEKKLPDGIEPQFIHKDRPTAEDGSMTILSMRHPVQEKKRNARTVIGNSAVVIPRIAEFIMKDTSDVHTEIAALQDTIRQCGIRTVQAASQSPTGMTWEDYILFHVANTVRGKGYPKLPGLYAHLSDILYFHEWTHDQLLLVHDDVMAHGRFPISNTVEGGGIAYQSHLQWERGMPYPFQLPKKSST